MNRSILLDFLRVFAISLVFLAHLGQLLQISMGSFFGIKNFYYVSLGGVGVSLFLVLSGILAGLTDANKKEGYINYIVKKILRIYPLYWMCVPLSILGYLLGRMLQGGDMPVLFPNGFLVDLFGSITGMYVWLGMWGGPYNSPSWFIGLIMTLYVLFPLVSVLMKRMPHVTIIIFLCISIVARYYVGKYGVPFVETTPFEDLKGWVYRQFGFMPGRPGDWFFPCRIFEFGLGVYLAMILPKTFWFKIQTKFSEPIRFLSDISFPLFLVHHPFMFMIVYLHTKGLPLSASISIFLGLLIFTSHLLNRMDQRFPRKKIMSLLRLGKQQALEDAKA